MSWKFTNGKACLKTKDELMHHVVTIPQTDGTEAALTLEANHVTVKCGANEVRCIRVGLCNIFFVSEIN